MSGARFENIVFVAAKRTAFGSFGGSLKTVTATDLAVTASRAALDQSGVISKGIDNPVNHVIMGNVFPSSPDGAYLARHVGLKAGLNEIVPAVTVNRLCGSGFEAIVQGARLLAFDDDVKTVLVGGTENMSQCPHSIYGARDGIPLGKAQLVDTLWEGLTDSYCKTPMGVTAENLATKYKISQHEVDEFSVRSQQLFDEAQKSGRLDDEITVTEVKKGRKVLEVTKDEHPRPGTTAESFAKLPRVFKKDGVVHAGSASGICDGAAALVMTTEKYAKKHGLTPLARLVSFGVAGCDPTIMGIGPVLASQIAVYQKAGLELDSIGLVEINEAFAPQVLACQKELGIPMEKLNVDGGAIAVGHPLGASGARITAHLIYAMKQRGERYSLGSACIGGGQGISVVLESI